MQKHMIWSNANLDIDDWREELEEQYPDHTENEYWRMMYEINAEYLEDEKLNLDIQLEEPILVIADLGLWSGRHTAYTQIRSGNIKDCLVVHTDSASFYVDENDDFVSEQAHHDGTNYITFRMWKKHATDAQREELMDKLYDYKANRAMIEKYTKPIGSYIRNVYGW